MRFIVIPLVVILICIILYTVFDYLSMGVFADWLDKLFTYEQSWVREDGTTVIVRNFNWISIKSYLLYVLIAVVLFGSWIFMLVSDFRKRRIQQKTAQQISEYMHRFISQNEPFPLELPHEYAEVFTEISEIRYEIQIFR